MKIFQKTGGYDDCQAGLGKEFAIEIFSTIQRTPSFLKCGKDYQKIQEDV